MKSVLSIFSIIVFLGSQSFSQSCLDNCAHHQKEDSVEASEHDCCDNSNSTENTADAKNCKFGDCFKIVDFEMSTFPVELQTKKKNLNFSLKSIGIHDSLVPISKNILEARVQDVWRDPPKVPVYIAYQKLLLP